jgi:translation elongation factor EF-4
MSKLIQQMLCNSGIEKGKIMGKKEKKLSLRYEQDSKRYHRFKIVDPEGHVTGSIYFSKKMRELPNFLVLQMEEK